MNKKYILTEVTVGNDRGAYSFVRASEEDLKIIIPFLEELKKRITALKEKEDFDMWDILNLDSLFEDEETGEVEKIYEYSLELFKEFLPSTSEEEYLLSIDKIEIVEVKDKITIFENV